MLYIILIPVLAVAGGVTLYNLAPSIASVNNTVKLAREIRYEKEKGIAAVSLAAVAYQESGKTEKELFDEEQDIVNRFRTGAPWVGIFLGLVLGLGFFSASTRNLRTEYLPDKGKCVSCGKCFKYCPVKIKSKV